MRVLTLSRSSLLRDGYAWVRVGRDGPGIHVGKLAGHSRSFSIRQGFVRYLKLGQYAVTYLARSRIQGVAVFSVPSDSDAAPLIEDE